MPKNMVSECSENLVALCLLQVCQCLLRVSRPIYGGDYGIIIVYYLVSLQHCCDSTVPNSTKSCTLSPKAR